MPDKEQRKNDAAKHISFVKGVFGAETANTLSKAKLYADGAGQELPIPEPRYEQTTVKVTTDFPVAALYGPRGKVAIVDAASFTRPGGNYEDGAFGPEQMICAESNLYPILCGMKDRYYDANRGYQCGMLFTGHAMYLPDVVFTRNRSTKKADVVVIAAPNRERALQNHRSPEECNSTMAARVEALLRIAADNEVDALVCGAFGCGSYGYDPQYVAELFKAWIDQHPGVFEQVVFAVARQSADAFERVFPKPVVKAKATVVKDDEDGDDFDWSDIDLPEGITLR